MPTAINYRENLQRPVVVSAVAHAGLVAVLLVSFPQDQRGESWGGPGGDAIQVSVVRNLPGVPLPRPMVVTQSRVASVSPGLHKAPPVREPKREETRKPATELPRFGEESKRQPALRARREEPPAPLPPGAIPSESAGPPALPYTTFQANGAQGGMSFGSGGGFGSRYPWYVASVQRRISSNWLLSSIDPHVPWAPRAVLTFEILRDGAVVNIQMMQSSGVPSVDRSAIRAIHDSSPLDQLPSDYRGEKVLVEFWFDFRRP